MNKILMSLGSALLIAFATSAATVQDRTDAEVIAAQKPAYPMMKCVVTGNKFSGERRPIEVVADGRLFLVANEEAKAKVMESPAEYAAKVDAAVIEMQTPLYPTDQCIVSSEELGSMGAPLEVIHDMRLVRLCCKGCKRAFEKDPAKFIAQIDAKMIEKQREDYPLETCAVSGEALGSMGEPIDRLYGVTLVRLCCKGCVRAFDRSPERFLGQVLEARRGAKKGRGEDKSATRGGN